MPLEMSDFCSTENKKKQEDGMGACADISLPCPILARCLNKRRGSFTQMHLLKVPNVGSRVPVYACFQAPELCRKKYLSLGERYQARPWPAVLSAYIFLKKSISQEPG